MNEEKDISERDKFLNVIPKDIEFERLIKILILIKEKPGRRDLPLEDDLKGSFSFWFNGGAATAPTGGGTTYYFKDGTQAHQPYPWESGYPGISIEFPDGEKINIVVDRQSAKSNKDSPTAEESNANSSTNPEAWFCISCGSKGGEASLCENCDAIRLPVENTVTLKTCRNCSRSNLVVAKFCAWCGESF